MVHKENRIRIAGMMKLPEAAWSSTGIRIKPFSKMTEERLAWTRSFVQDRVRVESRLHVRKRLDFSLGLARCMT
jgi:hypothetical protein